MNSAWGNRTGPDRSGVELFRTIWDQYLFWSGKSKPTLEFKRAIMGFHSKNGANPLNMYRSFTLGAERSKKLSDTERITFGIGVSELSQELRRTGGVKCEQKVYPIRFSGRSDNRSLQCEHGLRR